MPKQKPHNKHFIGKNFSHNYFHWQSRQVYKIVPDDCYEYPKKPAKTSKFKDQLKASMETANRFSNLPPDENPTDSVGKDSSLDSTCVKIYTNR